MIPRVLKNHPRLEIFFLFIILLLICLRIALPYGVKYVLNDFLQNKMETHTGFVRDVDLSLYRGSYQVEGLMIYKRAEDPRWPLLQISAIDLSLSWRSLFQGILAMDVKVVTPKINIIDSKNPEKQQYGKDESSWQSIFDKIIPIRIESFVVVDGVVKFLNFDTKPPVDIGISEINLRVQDIQTLKSKRSLPSKASATALIQNSGKVKLSSSLYLWKEIPDFDFNGEIVGLNLTELNSFFWNYAYFDVSKGGFSIYSELAMKDKKIKGYLKPMLKEVKVIERSEKFAGLGNFVNEVAAAAINWIIRTSSSKTVAAEIPLTGTYDDPKTDVWAIVKSVFKNGFKEPIKPGIENKINLRSAEP